MTAPALGLVLRPALVPRRLQPVYRVQMVVERWQRDHAETPRVLRAGAVSIDELRRVVPELVG